MTTAAVSSVFAVLWKRFLCSLSFSIAATVFIADARRTLGELSLSAAAAFFALPLTTLRHARVLFTELVSILAVSYCRCVSASMFDWGQCL